MQDEQLVFPLRTFLIGDSAYQPKSWMVVPFKNYGNLTQTQIDFNYIHSSTRMVVEHSFGYLKGRFRRIHHFTEQIDLKLLVKIITSACILHNICIIQNDLYDIDLCDEIDENVDDFVHEGEQENLNDRREEVIVELIEKGVLN